MTARCDGRFGCDEPITRLDQRGYVYCETHGLQRMMSQPCRKLRAAELRKLERGEQIARY